MVVASKSSIGLLWGVRARASNVTQKVKEMARGPKREGLRCAKPDDRGQCVGWMSGKQLVGMGRGYPLCGVSASWTCERSGRRRRRLWCARSIQNDRPYLAACCLRAAPVVLCRRHVLHNLQAEGAETVPCPFGAGEQANLMDAQLAEDLAAGAGVSGVDRYRAATGAF